MSHRTEIYHSKHGDLAVMSEDSGLIKTDKTHGGIYQWDTGHHSVPIAIAIWMEQEQVYKQNSLA